MKSAKLMETKKRGCGGKGLRKMAAIEKIEEDDGEKKREDGERKREGRG